MLSASVLIALQNAVTAARLEVGAGQDGKVRCSISKHRQYGHEASHVRASSTGLHSLV